MEITGMESRYAVHDETGGIIFRGSLPEVYDHILQDLYVHPMDLVKADENPEGYLVVFPLPSGEHGYISVIC